ncbi:hypothetical protein DSO57_1010840 [Entomophthora muscae]|uniref:Uncharacterized protein n=1 Tax=Entomophthora muscae TaxID=34485 RepID=A0ACC2RXA5_9FUNG|nr:hypothetical protein DSO57_1010840 [Entomophthora muscae]
MSSATQGLVSEGAGGCYPSDHVGYGEHPPSFTWPNGARVAVQFVLNYEEGGENTILNGDAGSEIFLTETPGGKSKIGTRDISTESIFEYGARCGVWRVLDLFKKNSLPITLYAVGKALEKNPHVGKRAIADGHEIACHHYRWTDYEKFDEHLEREHIRAGIKAIQNATGGIAPVGWYTGRQSENHRQFIVEEFAKLGLPLKYDADAYNDDRPYYVKVSPAPGSPPKPHLVIPYTLEVNDMKFGVVSS